MFHNSGVLGSSGSHPPTPAPFHRRSPGLGFRVWGLGFRVWGRGWPLVLPLSSEEVHTEVEEVVEQTCAS